MRISRKAIIGGLASAALFAALAMPLTLQAIVPPEVFNEKAEKSKIKAIAEVVAIKPLEENAGIERLVVTFKMEKRISSEQAPEEFVGMCLRLKGGKPKIGEELYFNPVKGNLYFVTVGEKDNEITSMTPISPRLMNALSKTPDKVKFRIGSPSSTTAPTNTWRRPTKPSPRRLPPGRPRRQQGHPDMPQLRRAYLARGKVFIEIDKYDSAEQDFDKALSLNPKLLDAYYQRGICKTNQGRFDAAIEDFTKVIDVDPKDLQALYCRASAYKYAGKLDKAIADFKGIEKFDKNNHNRHQQMAFCHYEKGELAEAKSNSPRTLELAPTDLYSVIFLHIVKSKLRSRRTWRRRPNA
jgi:tetratricopeptide (TPR) repeat protein